MANPVIHFEIQADDIDRAKDFYEKVFGWKISKMMSADQGGMDYWGVETKDKTGPGINGGMYKRGAEKWYTYDCTVMVADLDAAIAAVKANGGKIRPMPSGKEKDMIPGVGWFSSATDTEGNKVGLMQPTDWQPQ